MRLLQPPAGMGTNEGSDSETALIHSKWRTVRRHSPIQPLGSIGALCELLENISEINANAEFQK